MNEKEYQYYNVLVADRVQEDLSELKYQDVLCSRARMWFRSAMMMILNGQLEEALAANSKAEELLPLIKDPNIHQLVVEQQCTIKFATFQWLQSAPIGKNLKNCFIILYIQFIRFIHLQGQNENGLIMKHLLLLSETY